MHTTLTPEQRRLATAELWRAGDISYVLEDYQYAEYGQFVEWNERRQRPEYRQTIKQLDALYDNLCVDECGRRYGKTAKWLTIDVLQAFEIAFMLKQGVRAMIATPMQKAIGGIIVPLTKMLFRDAPKEFFPRYRGTHGADHECLYIEGIDSTIKLVGLDAHPDATRGQYLDFCHITEAAFVHGLHELVTGTIMPQFRYRPWAWCALETSTAKVADCDFNVHFRTDAQLRGAYRMRTIRDNPLLSEEEIEQEERRSGGKNSPQCRRELYCELVRDPDDMVVPEFSEAVHVVDPSEWERPTFAYAHVGIDPGVKDPFGAVGFYLDWEKQIIVVEWAFAARNISTTEQVQRIQWFERELWGTGHKAAGERRPELSILDATRTTYDGRVWDAKASAFTYWDHGAHSLKPNPYSRISDTAAQTILDMNKDHGMNVQPATKGPGSADAHLQHLRMLFGSGKIVVLKNGHTEPLIQQLRSGEWDVDETGHRTDWKRTPILGHLDCLAKGTLVETDRGAVPIEQIRAGDCVWTRAGLRAVTAAWRVGKRETWKLTTSAGTVVGTHDHRVLTDRGWEHLAMLTPSDMLCGWASLDLASPSCSTDTLTVATQKPSDAITACISPVGLGKRISTFITRCGSSITARFQAAWSSIIGTRTRSTTTSQILSSCLAASTPSFTPWTRSDARGRVRTSSARRLPAQPGTGHLRASGSTENRPIAYAAERSRSSTIGSVAFAELASLPLRRAQGSAEAFASPGGAASQASTTSMSPAPTAARHSVGTNTLRPSPVPVAVLGVEPTGLVEDVYDLTVDGEHEFFANGVLVHNCIAALQYAVRDVLWQRNPNMPAHIDPAIANEMYVPAPLREQLQHKAVPARFDRGGHSFARSTRTGFR